MPPLLRYCRCTEEDKMQIRNLFPLLAVSLSTSPVLIAKPEANFYLVQNTTTNVGASPALEALSVLKGQGIILDDDNPQEGALFLIDYTHSANNGTPVSTVIRQSDKAGNILVVEETLYNAQGEFSSYTIEQNQLDARGSVEKIGNSVRLIWKDSNNSKISSETSGDNLVTSGSLLAYMNSYINDLRLGKNLEVNMAIPERGACYSFDILPQITSKKPTASDLGVSISLSNFFLRKIVSPIKMSFQNSPEGYRPLSIVAPAAVRKKVGHSLERFTARIEYPRQ